MRVEFGYNDSNKLLFWVGYSGLEFAVGYLEPIPVSFEELSKSE